MNTQILPLTAALLCAVASPSTWAQTHSEFSKLAGLNGQRLDLTGNAVAISGNRVVSTAAGELDPLSGFPVGPTPGFAYLHDAATGAQVARLEAGDGFYQDYFGFSAAADGNFALVGAPFDALQVDLVGSVYVFDLQSGLRLRKLTASDGANLDRFGFSVAADGGAAVVGAPRDRDDGLSSGSVYLFDTATGLQLQKIRPNDGLQGRRFGTSVAIGQGLVVVGAPGGYYGIDQATGAALFRRAAAYVFDIQSGLQINKLDLGVVPEGEVFGSSVAITLNRIFVGAPDLGIPQAQTTPNGSVYAFDRTTGQLLNRLQPPIEADMTRFGTSIAADSGRLVVGASSARGVGPGSGAAFVFDVSTGLVLTRLIASDARAYEALGASVDIDGGIIAAGAPGDSDGALFAGAVYLFDGTLVNSGQAYCFQDGTGVVCPCGNEGLWGEGCSNSTGRGAELFGFDDAVIGMDTLVLTAAGLPAGVPGLFFQGSNQVNLPAGDGILCTSGSLRHSVQVTNAGGSVSRTGFGATATVGTTMNYQFWYRDPQNTCGQGGFNFSNGWTVDW